MAAGKSSNGSATPPAADHAAGGELALDQTMTYRLHKLHKLSDRVSQQAYLRETGLGLSEARCIGAIGAFAPLSNKDLAQRANLDKAQASRATQQLVSLELVSKQASHSDGRGVELSLTRKGRAAWRRVMQVIERRNNELLGVLTPAEQQQLSRLFDRMIAHAEEQADQS